MTLFQAHTRSTQAVFWLPRADPIAEVNLDTILSSRVNRTTQRHIGYLGYSSVSPIDISCLHVLVLRYLRNV